jgi:diguanylate cyclase (GGDEF)-like protein
MGNGSEAFPWLCAPWQETVTSLLADRFCINPQDAIASIRVQFEMNPQLQSQPVIVDDRPVGIFHRRAALGRVNDAAYQKSKAIDVMQAGVGDQLVVSDKTTIDALIYKISHKELDLSNGYLLVCDPAGHYLGRLVLADILEVLATLALQNNHHDNPLTHLPGHVPINEKLTELIRKNRLFVAAYCDIDGFKSYNDIYGYSCGDDVIQYTANLLRSHIDPQQDFLGHIGGDDFVIIFQSPDWFDRCDAIVHQCDEEAPHFYSGVHKEANGAYIRDRQGKTVFHPLFSLSIGAVSVEPGKFGTYHEIMAVATEVKKRAMSTHGGTIYIDERSYHRGITQQPFVYN